MAMHITSLIAGRKSRGLAVSTLLCAAAALLAALSFGPAQAQQPKPSRKGAQAAPAVPPPGAVDPGAVGVWIDHTGRGAVEIIPCAEIPAPGAAAPPPSPTAKPAEPQNLCGRIVWLQNPNDAKGKPLIDDLNKNPTKRGAPICGLQIIGEVKPQTDGSWDKGWIYDPEQGSAFDVELRLRNPETLQVKGYLGVKFLSETFVWRRAKQLPPKCPAA
jgi:uncharacterized protein (DUF2147 family)